MKILMLTPYVTLKGHSEFMKTQTGFGYMVMDIARAVAKTEEVSLLATDSRGDAFTEDGVHFLKRSIGMFLGDVFHCLPLSSVLKLRRQYPEMQKGTQLRVLYYWLMTGYLQRLLKKGKYDIVHIHGCSFSTELWMQVCQRCGQKFVVTLHGLNSFSDTVNLEPAGKQHERDFLRRVTAGEFPITVISTGMKKLIENTYDVKDSKFITVVCNSFNFSETAVGGGKNDVRKLYGIHEEARIILYVGNIGRRKNQGQLIRAFAYMPERIAEETYVLFLGANQTADYSIEQFAAKTAYPEHFIICGVVDKALVNQYYEQGNAVTLMSLSEGFGLSLIEGMHFGLPSMSFTDVDAYEDIRDECSMVGVSEHTDQAVAEGLVMLLTKNWNKEAIKQYSKKFESQNMAKQYVNVYQREI